MKVKEIMDLLDFISKSELNEVKLETQEVKLSVRKGIETSTRFIESAPVSHSVVQHQAPAAPAPAPVAPAAPTAPAPTAPASSASDNYITIKSPMIGTLYRSANPESPVFVNVGDKITKGQTICIIEAMKLFNEIESEVSGTVVKILVENSSPVEYDQPLFIVDPS